MHNKIKIPTVQILSVNAFGDITTYQVSMSTCLLFEYYSNIHYYSLFLFFVLCVTSPCEKNLPRCHIDIKIREITRGVHEF